MITHHPKNIYISNGKLARLYLGLLRGRFPAAGRLVGILLGTEIRCRVPGRLFLPHPYWIIAGLGTLLEEDVVLMQQVTLGGKDPHWGDAPLDEAFPVIRRGAYIGAGAKILGHAEVGEFAIVGANAVVTKDVPAGATVTGFNQLITRAQK
jgi:serine acetyltransferase